MTHGTPRCRRCGEPIHFLPKLSVIGHGRGYMPVNADDLKPHFSRCRITRELNDAKAKTPVKTEAAARSAADRPTQPEAALEPVTEQRDLF